MLYCRIMFLRVAADRFARRPSWFTDLLLALFVTAVQVQAASFALPLAPVAQPATGIAYALLVVSGMAVAARRRWPVPVFAVITVVCLIYFALDFPEGLSCLGLFVALYTLAAQGDGDRSLRIAGAGIAVLAVGWLLAAADIEPRPAIGWVLFRIGASVISLTLGESARSRRVLAADAQQRAELAERSREEEARSRVDAERLRIAREVHDTVAHAIAVINVQAGVTAHVLDKRPEQAKDALRNIEQTSSRALREMRAILGVLRDGDDRAPAPSFEQIADLAGKARDAGLDIEIRLGAPPTPIPGAVGSAAYRIVQEAITNVIRHAGPTEVTVAVEPGIDDLRIRVTDAGRRGAPTDSSADPGRGIAGMRERCQLLGGDLDAHARPQGGFEVSARLPLAPVGSAA